MSQLRPCAACGRHVRLAERCCPFCDAPQAPKAADEAVPARAPGVRLGRAAIFALGTAATAAATALAACSSGVPAPADDGGTAEGGAKDNFVPDNANVAKPYGAPPPREREDLAVEVV